MISLLEYHWISSLCRNHQLLNLCKIQIIIFSVFFQVLGNLCCSLSIQDHVSEPCTRLAKLFSVVFWKLDEAYIFKWTITSISSTYTFLDFSVNLSCVCCSILKRWNILNWLLSHRIMITAHSRSWHAHIFVLYNNYWNQLFCCLLKNFSSVLRGIYVFI